MSAIISLIMGCISTAGCLGPKQRQREVYLNLIEQIHNDASNVLPADSLEADWKDQTLKNDQIRKLIDNLTSHRDNIYPSLVYNFKIVAQLKNYSNKFIGLAIVNAMMTRLYPDANDSVISQRITKSRIRFLEIKSQKMDGQRLEHKTETVSKLTEIDIRFEQSYLKLVLHLLEAEQKIYVHVLQSLITFSKHKKEKLNILARDVANFILNRIEKKGDYPEESCLCYNMLLQKCKEAISERSLVVFLNLWMKHFNPLKMGLFSVSVAERLSLLYLKVINQCINKSILDTRSIYKCIFSVYQACQFDSTRMIPLEDSISEMVEETQMHKQFLRGKFIYFLEHIEPSQPLETTLSALRAVSRWVENGYVDLNDTISYNCSIFLNAYLCNVERDTNKQFVTLLYQVTDLLTAHTHTIMLQFLLESMRNTREQYCLKLVDICLYFIKHRPVAQTESLTFLKPLQNSHSLATQLHCIELTKAILQQGFAYSTEEMCSYLHSMHASFIKQPHKKLKKAIRAVLREITKQKQYSIAVAFAKNIEHSKRSEEAELVVEIVEDLHQGMFFSAHKCIGTHECLEVMERNLGSEEIERIIDILGGASHQRPNREDSFERSLFKTNSFGEIVHDQDRDDPELNTILEMIH